MLLSKTNIVSFINASFSSNLLSFVKNTPSCWILWNLSICRETIYCSENQFSHSCSFDRLVFWQTIIQPPHCQIKYNLSSLSNIAAIQQQCSSVIQGPYKNQKKIMTILCGFLNSVFGGAHKITRVNYNHSSLLQITQLIRVVPQ